MCKIWDFGHFRIRTPSFNKNYLVFIKKCSRQRMGNRAWTTTERNYWNHFYSQIINPWTEFQGEFGSVNSFPNSCRNYSGILNKQDYSARVGILAETLKSFSQRVHTTKEKQNPPWFAIMIDRFAESKASPWKVRVRYKVALDHYRSAFADIGPRSLM